MMTEDTVSDRSGAHQEVLNELVRRIAESVEPRRIILFGSAAHGATGPRSDLDILVIMPDGVHRRRTAQAIYRSLSGLGVAKDVVVVTESDVREHSENPSLVLYPALRHGKELFNAAG
jgi:predicted nucleotidyltransferase